MLSYPQTDVFLACYSVISPASYVNIRRVWIPEIRANVPEAPIILVGLKTDLREDPEMLAKLEEKRTAVKTFQDGEALALELKPQGVMGYVECSAIKDVASVDRVFEMAIRAARDSWKTDKKATKGRGCILQ